MEEKNFEAFTKSIDGRSVTGIAAVFGNIDSYGDIVHKGAFKKTLAESARVQHLWMHDFSQPPTATIKELREVGRGELPDPVKERFPEAKGGLLVVREYLDTPRGNEILAGITAGAIREMSFAYDPVKFDFETLEEGDEKGQLVRNLREVRLWDISDVNWGANPATSAAKAAVPYRDTGTAEEGASWSAPALKDFTGENWEDLGDGEKRRIAAHFAWQANNPPESYGDLKLPHHQAGTSGVGKAVWRGVAAAMGALLGARGGVQIPEGDRRGVYNHLARHYAQWEKEPPDYKAIQLVVGGWELVEEYEKREDGTSISRADTARDIRSDAEFASGRVLSARNVGRLKDALAVLEEILLAAEPPEDEELSKALTEQVLTRLAIAEREVSSVTYHVSR